MKKAALLIMVLFLDQAHGSHALGPSVTVEYRRWSTPRPFAFSFRLMVTLVLPSIILVQADFLIRHLDLVLEPTDVHFNDSSYFIQSPGFIDLGYLTFSAGEEPRQRRLDGGVEAEATAIDIAIFKLPRTCVHSKTGCDWADLGVGKRLEDGSLQWCCSQEAMDLGICDRIDDEYGRLMIDGSKFKGNHRFINIPHVGPVSKQIRFGKMEETVTGTYVVIYANCNEEGREVRVVGDIRYSDPKDPNVSPSNEPTGSPTDAPSAEPTGSPAKAPRFVPTAGLFLIGLSVAAYYFRPRSRGEEAHAMELSSLGTDGGNEIVPEFRDDPNADSHDEGVQIS